MFIQTVARDPLYFCLVCLIIVFSVCLHEFCHALIAYREGDTSVSDHLTLNPLKQMGLMSLFMLALIGIAWGTVPVNRDALRSRRSMLKVSLAGPGANLFLAVLAWSLMLIFALPAFSSLRHSSEAFNKLILFIFLLGTYNFMLFFFNLIPAPGLDGWNILSELVPRINFISSEFIKGFMLMVMLIAFITVPYLFSAGKFLMLSGPYLVQILGM